MKVKILGSAIEDLYAGRAFCEGQGEGLGAYFLDTIFSDIDSLILHAGIHPRISGYHRLLSRRFPYAVYYTTEEDVAVVHRILDLRRDSNSIRRALT